MNTNLEKEKKKLKIKNKSHGYDKLYDQTSDKDYEDYDDFDKFIDISNMPPLECNEEEKEGTRLKILVPNKLMTRLPILLPQIEAGNNLSKLKNEVR